METKRTYTTAPCEIVPKPDGGATVQIASVGRDRHFPTVIAAMAWIKDHGALDRLNPDPGGRYRAGFVYVENWAVIDGDQTIRRGQRIALARHALAASN